MRPIAFDKEPAYILHRRPYQESTYLLDFLTPNHGRIVVMARQSARMNKEPFQLFTPMFITCSQGNTLLNLRSKELSGKLLLSEPQPLMLGLYFNELLLKLVPQHSKELHLFALYSDALERLASPPTENVRNYYEAVLRHFEVHLLEQLGYRLQLQYEANSKVPLRSDALYHYEIEAGASVCKNRDSTSALLCHGETLMALKENFIDSQVYNKNRVLSEAKNLLRVVLKHHLQGKNINTRTLFQFLHAH
ncbi:MAG: DNA repair protein RecO [Candidatus Oxydemutatoraceae bacterium WSBS_2016_MAG_OTU14]